MYGWTDYHQTQTLTHVLNITEVKQPTKITSTQTKVRKENEKSCISYALCNDNTLLLGTNWAASGTDSYNPIQISGSTGLIANQTTARETLSYWSSPSSCCMYIAEWGRSPIWLIGPGNEPNVPVSRYMSCPQQIRLAEINFTVHLRLRKINLVHACSCQYCKQYLWLHTEGVNCNCWKLVQCTLDHNQVH